MAKKVNDRFIRVRVVIAANEPLLRSIRVDLLGNGKITTMLLRYERLLDYCFKCVRIMVMSKKIWMKQTCV